MASSSQSRNPSWIESVANELGIENLDSRIKEELEKSVKTEMQLIMQDSLKFARHSCRRRLLPSDIHNTLNMRNSPPIIGCNATPKFYDAYNRQQHTHSSHSQEDGKADHVHTHSSKAASSMPRSGNNIMIKQDSYVKLEQLKNECLSKPAPISVIVSWLAINGTVIGGVHDQTQPANHQKHVQQKGGGSASSKIEIKPIQCHDISKEQQLFFEYLRNTVIKGDTHTLNTFLDILENADAGLARLVPRIVQFIAKTVKDNVNQLDSVDLHLLYCLMRIAESLILSRYLSNYLENYLQQFMPPILTCCMKENLSISPSENHWNLRNKAAKIVQLVLDKFDKKFPKVRQKVIRTLITHFTDFTKTFKTHYGAIVCLKEIGIDALQVGLLPHVEQYIAVKLKPFVYCNSNSKAGARHSAGDDDAANAMKVDARDTGTEFVVSEMKQNVIKQYEAKMVLGALLESLWICGHHQHNQHADEFNHGEENKKTLKLFCELQDIFGDALVPFNPTPPDCEHYFI